jgi:ubiquinone biosynthesis protein Coq4
MRPTIERAFADELIRTFDDPDRHPVHLLFNRWWRHAPDEVKSKYLADFAAVPEQHAYLEARYFAEPLDLDALAALPEGSLGRAYREFIVANGLDRKIALHYRALHDAMKQSGALDGMPEPFQYAVLRGFQVHDFLHVVTGYDSSPRGELALQAFCLAQFRFPYFGMWMSVVCTRMTFLDPDAIRPVMDAISHGWQWGRRVENLQFERWEERVAEPLRALRERFGVAPGGLPPIHG